MIEVFLRFARDAALAACVAVCVVADASAVAAGQGKTQSLWFDPTQLPSFTGTVDRFLANPDGHVDRLVFTQGPQIAFPPDAFEAIQQVASAGKPLVVWGIRARAGPVITMLAFAAADGEPTVLDRFYWRPEPSHEQARRKLVLNGTVWVPYLSPQGQTAGAILENGDVIRVDPPVAAARKERFTAGARLAAEGNGSETHFGKAIDAERIGESPDNLEPVVSAHQDAKSARPASGTSRPHQ